MSAVPCVGSGFGCVMGIFVLALVTLTGACAAGTRSPAPSGTMDDGYEMPPDYQTSGEGRDAWAGMLRELQLPAIESWLPQGREDIEKRRQSNG